MQELEAYGFDALDDDLMKMASHLSAEHGGKWKSIAESILQEAAEPIKAAAIRHVPVRTGKLRDAIIVGRVKKRKHKAGGYTVDIGNQEKGGVGYARLVEFGHGGPAPAPNHKFMRPAYAEASDQAYAIIRKRLNEEVNKIGG